MVYSLAGTSFLAGVVTVLVPGLLTGPPAMNGSARGTALVVASCGAPLLLLAHHRARAGSSAALAVATGATAYLLYNAVLLVFATPFNRAFPLYEATLGLAIYTLVGLAYEVWRRAEECLVPACRWQAAFVLLLVGLNAVAWGRRLVPALLGDAPRSMLAGTGLTTNPVYVQDLAFWLPTISWVAVGMWKAHAPRVSLGAGVLCYWVLESVSVAVDQWWGSHADPASTVTSSGVVPVFAALAVLTIWPLVSVASALARVDARPGPAVPGGSARSTEARGTRVIAAGDRGRAQP
jgi:hypothetical protein